MKTIKKYPDLSVNASYEVDLNDEPCELSLIQMSLVRAVSSYKMGKITYVEVMDAIKRYREYLNHAKSLDGDLAIYNLTIADLIRSGCFGLYKADEPKGLDITAYAKTDRAQI